MHQSRQSTASRAKPLHPLSSQKRSTHTSASTSEGTCMSPAYVPYIFLSSFPSTQVQQDSDVCVCVCVYVGGAVGWCYGAEIVHNLAKPS